MKNIKHDHINHIDLRSDIENDLIKLSYLTPEGKVNSEPEAWAINNEDIGRYIYDSKTEYEQDLKILGLSN